MKVTFWGSRGSIPAPGPSTVRVGGNTTCIEITEGSERIIIDAGTGIRSLGTELMTKKCYLPITMLMTHSHWDHLAGFIFFPPAYSPHFKIALYGNPMALKVIKQDIFERRDNRYFPVNMDDFRADITFQTQFPPTLKLNNFRITTLNLNHPGNGYAFRIASKNKTLVFMSDNELGLKYEGGATYEEMIKFCQKADLLVHDAQYLPEEINRYRGWGHSTYAEAVQLAVKSQVPNLILTHHDPARDDAGCFFILESARAEIMNNNYDLNCDLAIEGMSVQL